MIKYINTFVLFVLINTLSGCSVYSTGFNCPDSKGARCVMLSEIDKRVDSGEIETLYLDKKCKGENCSKQINDVPKKAIKPMHKVKIIPIEDGFGEYQDGNDLYIK